MQAVTSAAIAVMIGARRTNESTMRCRWCSSAARPSAVTQRRAVGTPSGPLHGIAIASPAATSGAYSSSIAPSGGRCTGVLRRTSRDLTVVRSIIGRIIPSSLSICNDARTETSPASSDVRRPTPDGRDVGDRRSNVGMPSAGTGRRGRRPSRRADVRHHDQIDRRSSPDGAKRLGARVKRRHSAACNGGQPPKCKARGDGRPAHSASAPFRKLRALRALRVRFHRV